MTSLKPEQRNKGWHYDTRILTGIFPRHYVRGGGVWNMETQSMKNKLTKRVDEICSDDTGADKPYKQHCEKWGAVLADDLQKEFAKNRSMFLDDIDNFIRNYNKN